MRDMFSLKGKVAIITGGNGGIGEGVARGFAGSGANIVIAARNRHKTDSAVEGIRKEFNVEALGIQVDVRKEEQVASMVKEAFDSFGHVDVLVNNAGMNIRKMPQDLTSADYDEVLSTDLRSVFLCSKAVYPIMKNKGGGKIINTASIAGNYFGQSMGMAYNASKAGVIGMTRALAIAWAPDNIQVNAILPGFIDTELTKGSRAQIAGFNERVINRTPSGRWGKPEDLQGIAIFLAAEASNFVTGAALVVDGGFSVNM